MKGKNKMYWLIELKDHMLNYIAKWCINHCYLYCDTIYALLMKLRINDIEYFCQETIKYKKENS